MMGRVEKTLPQPLIFDKYPPPAVFTVRRFGTIIMKMMIVSCRLRNKEERGANRSVFFRLCGAIRAKDGPVSRLKEGYNDY
jgi:hypothetical protein